MGKDKLAPAVKVDADIADIYIKHIEREERWMPVCHRPRFTIPVQLE